MKKQKGFTLMELMIVVAIIGIISAIAFPSYNSYMKKSRRADAKVGLSKLADKQERFYLQNNIYTTSFAATGLNTSTTSDEGYYTFAVTSANTAGFTLSATAVASKAQANDTGCTVMTLSSTGARNPDGNPATEKDCW